MPRRRGIVSFIQRMLLAILLLESTLLAVCAHTSILAFSRKDAVESLSRRVILSQVGEKTRTSNRELVGNFSHPRENHPSIK